MHVLQTASNTSVTPHPTTASCRQQKAHNTTQLIFIRPCTVLFALAAASIFLAHLPPDLPTSLAPQLRLVTSVTPCPSSFRCRKCQTHKHTHLGLYTPYTASLKLATRLWCKFALWSVGWNSHLDHLHHSQDLSEHKFSMNSFLNTHIFSPFFFISFCQQRLDHLSGCQIRSDMDQQFLVFESCSPLGASHLIGLAQ